MDSQSIALQSQQDQGIHANNQIKNSVPVVDSNSPSQESANGVSNTTSTSFMRGLMYLTPAQMQAFQAHRATMPTKSTYSGQSLPAGSVSLLSSVPYLGENRDQGHCGNCWVWASTGALEIAHSITNNVSDRLSIQFFDSNWNNGSVTGNACSGGWPYQVADFYNSTLSQVIPWSNTNASYADYNWTKGNRSGIPASYISTTPNYPLTSVFDTALLTNTSQSTAITNIKSELNAHRPVIWSFLLPETGWTAFANFWNYQNESVIWDPDPYSGGVDAGGHAVLIVGYDDTVSVPYWLVLNSWGTTSQRLNGVFKLKMQMNYSTSIIDDNKSIDQNYYDIYTTAYHSPTPTPTVTPTVSPTYDPYHLEASFKTDRTSGAAPLHVQFTDTSSGSPNSYYWYFTNGISSTEKNPFITFKNPGNYSVFQFVSKNSLNSVEYKENLIQVL
ncbi:MAG: PKD domain-containing protein [Methanospirillum sp.]|uniref:C1 family peptidase n=1 Tax=Methanospirillum sp. TaxID=45200 RepID=UPI00236F0FAE|nr:C1 family peptidase [Methanospirillum sp.]MDD1729267.1 PKD domain-containing protein [Methanospirillum sp.]